MHPAKFVASARSLAKAYGHTVCRVRRELLAGEDPTPAQSN